MNRVLQWVIWFAAMTVVMRWLAKSREVPASEQSLVLQYPRAILATGVVVGAMFLVMAVASFLAPSGGPGVAAIFLIFVALGAYLVAEYYVVRFDVVDDGLAYRTLFQRGVLRWPDITRISWSPSAKWMVLAGPRQRVHVSALLRNLPVLAQTILVRVPTDRIEAEARALLEGMAAGRLPQIWG